MAFDALRAHPARSLLAILGVVIGIVTVVLVASVLVNLRNQVALLFRELGTENIFAFHLSGRPVLTGVGTRGRRGARSSRAFAREIARLAPSVREVGVQMIVPNVVNGRALVARAGGNESDTVLVEGASANYFEVVGADFARRTAVHRTRRAGRRARRGDRRRACRARSSAVRRPSAGRCTLAGETYVVVGELAPRNGGFFGENRQDNVLAIPFGAVQRRFAEADRTILYIRAMPDRARPGARRSRGGAAATAPASARTSRPTSTCPPRIRSSGRSIRWARRSAWSTIALAGVSLLIGGIGIANVMIIGVTERTREIGIRMALGARRARGAAAVPARVGAALDASAASAGSLWPVTDRAGSRRSSFPGFSAVPPAWAVVVRSA